MVVRGECRVLDGAEARAAVVAAGPYGYREVNVEAQARDPASLLRWLTHMIHTRKRCPQIGAGRWRIIPTRNPHVVALAYADASAGTVVSVHNFDERPHEVTLNLDAAAGDRLASLLDEDDVVAGGPGRYHVQIDALGYRWYRAQRARP